jgi:hypothetical protein
MWNYFRYLYFILRHLPLKRLIRSAWHWFIVSLSQVLKTQSHRQAPHVDLESLRALLREESIKARKPGQLKPLLPVNRLRGLALERFE